MVSTPPQEVFKNMDNDDSPMSTRCRNTPFPDKQLLHPHHPPLTEPLGMLLDVEISDWTRWDRLRNVGTLGPPVQHTKNRSFAAPILGQTLWSEQPPKRFRKAGHLEIMRKTSSN